MIIIPKNKHKTLTKYFVLGAFTIYFFYNVSTKLVITKKVTMNYKFLVSSTSFKPKKASSPVTVCKRVFVRQSDPVLLKIVNKSFEHLVCYQIFISNLLLVSSQKKEFTIKWDFWFSQKWIRECCTRLCFELLMPTSRIEIYQIYYN